MALQRMLKEDFHGALDLCEELEGLLAKMKFELSEDDARFLRVLQVCEGP